MNESERHSFTQQFVDYLEDVCGDDFRMKFNILMTVLTYELSNMKNEEVAEAMIVGIEKELHRLVKVTRKRLNEEKGAK